ncbi:S-adenosyl-L-methionine-dependent methyltransferase [Neolentinus lepideus HHB14362 ss-1]|uniref:tRNA (cytosine(38)-C(5))-methyltransferase n=1 Tax=Neolentinus lepideus HHB14362 ss-1 TaxID=1314782 RepID=A0A165S5E4_9AGAM|nr:S-adenosyl-L-methionine-dependent methyltransferase [Neolentinus lepideus HHB14362 ss-1]
MTSTDKDIRVLEFYSGIGGLRAAFERSSVSGSVVQSFDWDQAARQVYETNYGSGTVVKVDIGTLTASQLPPAELWLLSPSCQPYTVLNPEGRGEADPRAKSFLHLVEDVLPDLAQLAKLPKYLLIENVAGFETSTTRQKLLSTLRSLGYSVLEILLTPLQFGVPNSRFRYYCLAKLSPLCFSHIPPESEIRVWKHIPGQGEDWEDPRGSDRPLCSDEIRLYLDDEQSLSKDSPYKIPDKVLLKWGRLFDIAKPTSRRTCCFTRGYTQMVERSGSILQTEESLDTTAVFDQFLAAKSSTSEPPSDPIKVLRPLGLRYFSPTELLRLFCFLPPTSNPFGTKVSFKWPETISMKTKYRLIGNSVNVEVVRRLVEYMFSEPTSQKDSAR